MFTLCLSPGNKDRHTCQLIENGERLSQSRPNLSGWSIHCRWLSLIKGIKLLHLNQDQMRSNSIYCLEVSINWLRKVKSPSYCNLQKTSDNVGFNGFLCLCVLLRTSAPCCEHLNSIITKPIDKGSLVWCCLHKFCLIVNMFYGQR